MGIRLFEYEEDFIEMIKEIKGDDTMSSLAQRWLDEGFKNGIQTGMKQGIFETAVKMIEKFNLSIDDVIKKLNIKKEDFLRYIENSTDKK